MQRPFFQPESAPKISLFSRPFAKTSGRDSQRLLAGYTQELMEADNAIRRFKVEGTKAVGRARMKV